MDIQDLIKTYCEREIESGCYDIKINNLSIYNFIRSAVRYSYSTQMGFPSMEVVGTIKKTERIKNIFISIFQILWLILKNKKYNTFIYSFNRVDKVGDYYIDKFTDPLIDFSHIKDSYIIFEGGRKGRHFKPRLHHNKIIYTNAINKLCRIYSNYKKLAFFKKYQAEIEELFRRIKIAFPEYDINDSYLLTELFCNINEAKFYKFLFKRLHIQNFLAPNRYDFNHIIPFAKQCDIHVYELQHGISIGESHLYSGYRDKMFTPDLFLAYGEMSLTERYGIDIDKIKVIGWAFDNYLSTMIANQNNVNDNDVLVISEAHVTEKMIAACHNLAETNTNIHFYYRPHPNEILSEEQKNRLTQYQNIHIDDNTQNILVTLHQFKHIIGENSTVLYEALSYGKKVGKLYMNGLAPKDLDEEDPEYFWRIEDADSFKNFINASPEEKKQRKIYSKFDRKFFEDLVLS